MVTQVTLIIMLCLFVFDGFVWVAMLAFLSRIFDLLAKKKEDEE